MSLRKKPLVLSLIIPVYNEKETILKLISKVKATEVGDLKKEIIVIDDGSTDGTREKLIRLNYECLKVIFHPKNLGKGSAIKTGIKEAKGEVVIFQDADLEYDPDDYPKLIKPLLEGKADIVYGSRFLGQPKDMTLIHRLGNRFLTFVVNLLYNLNLTDVCTGSKAFFRYVLESFEIESSGFEVEVELTAKASKRKYRIVEVPIFYQARGFHKGKKISWRNGFVFLKTIFKYKF